MSSKINLSVSFVGAKFEFDMKYFAILLVAAVIWVPSVRTYPGGPPTSTCTSMMPATGPHGSQQTSASPYQLVLDKQTVNSGETVSITLSKIQTTTPDFKGFMIEAVDPTTNAIVGKFTSDGYVFKVPLAFFARF